MFDQVTGEKLLLVHHVADRLGIRPRTVRWRAKTGRIPAVKAGIKIWTFRESDIERLRSQSGDRSGEQACG